MNGLHYQKPSTPRWRCRYLKAPRTDVVPVQSWLQDGPLLR